MRIVQQSIVALNKVATKTHGDPMGLLGSRTGANRPQIQKPITFEGLTFFRMFLFTEPLLKCFFFFPKCFWDIYTEWFALHVISSHRICTRT